LARGFLGILTIGAQVSTAPEASAGARPFDGRLLTLRPADWDPPPHVGSYERRGGVAAEFTRRTSDEAKHGNIRLLTSAATNGAAG